MTEPRDYTNEMTLLVMLAKAAAEIDVDLDFVGDTLSKAEGFGPFLDPTAFTKGRAFKNLEEQREVFTACAPFIRRARKLKAQIGAEAVNGQRVR